MAKCAKCGKRGLFLKLADGLCADCISIKYKKLEQDYNSLKTFVDEIGATDALTIKRKADEYKSECAALNNTIAELQKAINILESEVTLKKNDILVIDEELMLESFALYKPKFKFTSSEEYKDRLEKIREEQKKLVKAGTATNASIGWTVNGSTSEGRKMLNDMIKLLLRSFNNECDYCIDNVKFNNFEANVKRIDKSFEQCNKLGRITQVTISDYYKNLKLDELRLAFEYQQKKQEEKEEQKRLREEQREQQKLEHEIREARDRILKERKHFNAAIKELEKKLLEAVEENEKLIIEKNLKELKENRSELDKEEKVIDYREQNAKAGYVYVISNIGSFGEGVYKIGMTRRLEPMERVDELGDASVPFVFDVHTMIFSDDAPALEAKLHEHFHKNRINKINNRKEFYRADLNEIEKVIKDNYKKVVDVIKEAPAEQYRESLKMGDLE